VEAEKIPNLRLGDFFINSLNPGEVPVLNLVKRTGEELIWNGIAVIQDGKWLGTLGRDETFFLMHIRFNQLGGDVHVPCPGKEGYLVFQPDRMKSEIDVKEGQTAHINLTQTIHGRLIERSCFIDLGSKTVEKMAEHLIENHYERHATKLLDKLQHHMKVDALQLGSHVHAFAPSLWEKADWKQTFSRMPIRVHYRVYVDRIGSIAK
jgi:spore germination protein KC